VIQELCIVDVETTGLDPKSDEITEVGAIQYRIGSGVIASWSTRILTEKHPHAISRMPAVPAARLPARDIAIAWLLRFASRAEAIVAHYACFDRGFLPELDGREWICSKTDLDWPNRSGLKLVEIALAHGVPVWRAHRALDDCQLIAALFDTMGDELSKMIADARLPRITVMALVSFEENQKARDAGFEWNTKSKQWLRKMRRDQIDALPFQYREIS